MLNGKISALDSYVCKYYSVKVTGSIYICNSSHIVTKETLGCWGGKEELSQGSYQEQVNQHQHDMLEPQINYHGDDVMQWWSDNKANFI